MKMAWDQIDPAIITKSFKKCSISNDSDGTEDDALWAEQYDKSNTHSNEDGEDMYNDIMTHDQIQDMMNVFGFESILLILVHFISGVRLQGGFIGSKKRCILYTSATYRRVYMVTATIN